MCARWVYACMHSLAGRGWMAHACTCACTCAGAPSAPPSLRPCPLHPLTVGRAAPLVIHRHPGGQDKAGHTYEGRDDEQRAFSGAASSLSFFSAHSTEEMISARHVVHAVHTQAESRANRAPGTAIFHEKSYRCDITSANCGLRVLVAAGRTGGSLDGSAGVYAPFRLCRPAEAMPEAEGRAPGAPPPLLLFRPIVGLRAAPCARPAPAPAAARAALTALLMALASGQPC